MRVQSLLKIAETRMIDMSGLSEKEQKLLACLSLEEKHIDTLIESARLSPADASATLIQLELKGLVSQKAGKMFISNCN